MGVFLLCTFSGIFRYLFIKLSVNKNVFSFNFIAMLFISNAKFSVNTGVADNCSFSSNEFS